MRFLLENGGDHVENGVTYKKGDVVETETNLEVLFGRTKKFRRIDNIQSPEKTGGKDTKNLSTSALTEKESDTTTVIENDGDVTTDVTSMVDVKLLDKGLRVVKRGPWYYLIDKATGADLNEKGMKKDDMDEFIKEYL